MYLEIVNAFHSVKFRWEYNDYSIFSFALKPGGLLLFSNEKKVNKNSCRLPSAFENFHRQIYRRTNLANDPASIC